MKTYVAIVLDRSGSMETGRQETINGFNEQIQTLKSTKTEDNNVIVSLVTFDHIVTPEFVKPVEEVEPLTKANYVPDGLTALHDAVGYTIDELLKLDDIEDKDTAVLMVIISDGGENASKKVRQKDLAEKIQMLQGTERWTFTYMGANVDLSKVSKDLNIPLGNMATFDASWSTGYENAFTTANCSTKNYMNTRSTGKTTTDCFYAQPEDKE